MAGKLKTLYSCAQCGGQTPKWQGQCPHCGAWNSLVETLRSQRRPDGAPVYSTLTGLTLMVFYVFALQCISTVAVVRRETNSWKWPFLQWFYMGVLAWSLAFATKLIGHACGL